MGGISTVVNIYYDLGLDKKVKLKYISSMKEGSKPKKLFIALWAYIQFCFCLRHYGIVHVHMAAQASFTRKSVFIRTAAAARKKIIIHQHAADFNDFYFRQSDAVKRKKIRDVFSYADKVIVLSEEWERFFAGNVCGKEKIVILHNGVAIPDYRKTDYSDHAVLFLGRLGVRKGVYDLLRAIPEVLKHVPDAEFYLCGDGDVKQCRLIAVREGFSDHAAFPGWVAGGQREAYLKGCSVFVLPSYHEGMPMALLEAMSRGLAAVSTNAGGIPQIIDDGVNGYRVEAGDIRSITDRLVGLLTDRALKKRLGEAAAETIAKRFNAVSNVDALYNLYREMDEGK